MEEEEEEGDKKSRKEAGLARRYTNRTPNTNEDNGRLKPIRKTKNDRRSRRDSRRILARKESRDLSSKEAVPGVAASACGQPKTKGYSQH